MEKITFIYPAKKIITMNPEQPFATAVAVRDGRILGVGSLKDLIHWIKKSVFTPYEIDTTFQKKIIMPGLVDGHTHIESQALLYQSTFVSQIPWANPKGGLFPTYMTRDAVFEKLKELDQTLPPGKILYAGGYNENLIGPIHKDDLDGISRTRPILISNLVIHKWWANSRLLEKADLDPANPPHFAEVDENGKITGMFSESLGGALCIKATQGQLKIDENAISYVMPLFSAGGCTTVAECGLGAYNTISESYKRCQSFYNKDDVNLRVVAMPWARAIDRDFDSMEEFIAFHRENIAQNTDKIRFGPVKLYLDGSLISHTTPIGWPGYWDGVPEPGMAFDPDVVSEQLIALHQEGIQTMTHTNSTPGIDVMLDAIERAQQIAYRPDIRHRLEHCYGLTEAQAKRAKALGVAIQFFTTQIYYYGDGHMQVQGPDRGQNICPTGMAERLGLTWGVHNDPPGTPQLPWTAIWATVNRLTESGEVLNSLQKVPVQSVLRANTIDSAYQLHLDHETGSIVFGKRADFCILEEDPLTVDPMELRHIPVWGTIYGGKCNPARQ